MGKIITTFAMSLDNYIADEHGGYDWIKGDGHLSIEDSFWSYNEFLDNIDYVVMGKKSYEEGMHKQFPDHQVIVVTHNPEEDDSVSFETDIPGFIQMIRQTTKQVYIFGGGVLVDSIRDEIDEWILGIVPTLLGTGRKVFSKEELELTLTLTDYAIKEGIVLLKYVRREQ